MNLDLDVEGLDINLLFESYNEHTNIFIYSDFKKFIQKKIKKSKKFEENTGIPKKYFLQKINNLALFNDSAVFGYIKVKNVYVYSDGEYTYFIKNKKIISKIKDSEKIRNWLVNELDKIFPDCNINEDFKDENYKKLKISKNIIIQNINNIYMRFYLNVIYDIIICHKNILYPFYRVEQITENSFVYHRNVNPIKMKRKIKLCKLYINDILRKF